MIHAIKTLSLGILGGAIFAFVVFALDWIVP